MTSIARGLIEIERQRVRSDRWLFLGLVGAVALSLFGAQSVKVPVSVQAVGTVIAPSRVQSVGSAEGGLVSKVLVRPYDRVEAGQALVELDPAIAEADIGRMEYAARTARGDALRLEAELADKEPDLSSLPEDQAASVRLSWKARSDRRAEEVAAKEAELAALRGAQVAYRRTLAAGEEVLVRLQEGAKSGYVALNRAADQLRQVEEMRGRVVKGEADIKASIAQINALKSVQRESIAKDLAEAQAKRFEAEQQLAKASAQAKRTVLRSPVSGRIKTLVANGPGAAFKPGEAIVEIVEGGEEMRVEAHIAAEDRGHVSEGAIARVVLAGDDGSHEGISGKVLAIAPDAAADASKKLSVAMEVSLPSKAFQGKGGVPDYRLSEGVPVRVFVSYGERTLLQSIAGRFLGQSETWLEGR